MCVLESIFRKHLLEDESSTELGMMIEEPGEPMQKFKVISNSLTGSEQKINRSPVFLKLFPQAPSASRRGVSIVKNLILRLHSATLEQNEG